jgi:CRP-like cAMP-binding protein
VKKKKGAFVRKRVKASFDPKMFLASVGEGKTISKYRKDQIVFSQGQVADAVFYIQHGKVKLTVVSEQGKEAVVAHMTKCVHNDLVIVNEAYFSIIQPRGYSKFQRQNECLSCCL